MRRPTTSTRLQISSASGINNSSPRTSTTSIGVPACCASPVDCTSITLPISDGASLIKQGERRNGRFTAITRARHLKHRAPHQILHKILPRRQHHPLLKRNQHIQPAKLLRLIDRRAPLEPIHRLPRVIPIDPKFRTPTRRGAPPRSPSLAPSPKNTSFSSFNRWGKSVRSSTATSPLLPRARKIRANATHFCRGAPIPLTLGSANRQLNLPEFPA